MDPCGQWLVPPWASWAQPSKPPRAAAAVQAGPGCDSGLDAFFLFFPCCKSFSFFICIQMEFKYVLIFKCLYLEHPYSN